jgi:hypothetical protein
MNMMQMKMSKISSLKKFTTKNRLDGGGKLNANPNIIEELRTVMEKN